ncbi:hypothetical protein RQ63_20810, partial [Acinetobacter baumannii]
LNLAQLGALCISNLCATKPNETNRPITEDYPSAKIIMDELNKSSDEMAEKIKTQQKVNADW